MVRFDPYSYEHHEDPYPTYRRMRDEAPAYLDPTAASGRFPATTTCRARHRRLADVLVDRRHHPRTPDRGRRADAHRDGPAAAHRAARAREPGVHAHAGSPISKRRSATSPASSSTASAGTRAVDVIEDFAAKLPMAVISRDARRPPRRPGRAPRMVRRDAAPRGGQRRDHARRGSRARPGSTATSTT